MGDRIRRLPNVLADNWSVMRQTGALIALLWCPWITVIRADRPAEQVAPKTAGYTAPRTPWGDPDLNGVWPSIDMVRVPMQLPPRYGTRLFMTRAEHDELEARENE